MRHAIGLGFLLFCSFLLTPVQGQSARSEKDRTADPALLSFDELVTLSSTAKPQGLLATRLDDLLTRPFVRNDASGAGVQPHRPPWSVLDRFSGSACGILKEA
jgi:hypothetical protein